MGNLYPCNKKSSGGSSGVTIAITTSATKTAYAQYDTLDLSGMVVTATYPGGTTADVTSAITSSPANGATLSSTGTQLVTITYNDSTVAFNITVEAMTSISVTTMPTKTTYQPDEQLDLTGIVVTGTAGALSSVVTSGCTFNPADGTTLTTEGTIPVTVTYHGLTTSFNVTCTASILEPMTWAQIQTAIRNGTLPQSAVGQTKSFSFEGYTYHMQLASINDGTGSAGTYYPNHTADFISVELLNDTHNMNSTDTNVGGWNDCAMRTYLNSTIYPALPSDLRAVIIDKTHMRTAGNKSTSLVSASDKLWLPTYYEMFGQNSQYYLDDADHNIHYSIFPDSRSRIKYRLATPTTAQFWWLSSPFANNSSSFALVRSYGDDGSINASTSYGVAIGLRIG